jgi:hypothetical protein
MHHDDWKWKFSGQVPFVPSIDIYRLSRGSRQTLVFRDKDRRNLDFSDPALYRDLAACLRSQALPSVTFFCLKQQPVPASNTAQMADFRKQVADLSASQGLCVQTLEVVDNIVYAEFRGRGCTQEQPAGKVTGVNPRTAFAGT